MTCPPETVSDIQSNFREMARRMAEEDGIPAPSVEMRSYYTTVAGKRVPVEGGKYDFLRRRILLNPENYVTVSEPGRVMQGKPRCVWGEENRVDMYESFYHEYRHHKQLAEANWDPRIAFPPEEMKKPHEKRSHEIDAKEAAEKCLDLLRRCFPLCGRGRWAPRR